MPLLLFALFFARFAASHQVLPRVRAGGIALGGLAADDARRRLEQRRVELASAQLKLAVGERTAAMTLAELGIELIPDASLRAALAVGRDGGAASRLAEFARSFAAAREVPLALRVDEARFSLALARLATQLLPDAPAAARIETSDGVARVVPARRGRVFAVGTRARCVEAVSRGNLNAKLELPVREAEPASGLGAPASALAWAEQLLSAPLVLEAGARRLQLSPRDLGPLLISREHGREVEVAIDPTRLAEWLSQHAGSLEAEARDATFEVLPSDQLRLVPAESGVRLDADDVAAALALAAKSDARRAALPLRRQPEPKRSTEQAEKLGIHRLVGSFTTRHPCCQPRVDNIHRIAMLVDGLLVEPGETVSLNAVVGPRSQKNGFVLAPSIEDGEMVDSVGGGVSQFATTIFNALFHAGYDIIERQPHTYWFPRYPMGHDATLGFPKPDIVFKNDSAYGLLIKTSFSDRSITVKLYGDLDGRRVSSGVSERRDIVQPAVEYLPNRDVSPDEEKIKDGGMIGWSVIASRSITFADGSKKEEKRKVTYKPKARRVEVHPCKIPKGEPGATGERCPDPPPESTDPEPAEAQ